MTNVHIISSNYLLLSHTTWEQCQPHWPGEPTLDSKTSFQQHVGLTILPPIWKTFPSSKTNSSHWDPWLWLRKMCPCGLIISIVPVYWHCGFTPLWVRIICSDRHLIPHMVVFPLWVIYTQVGLEPLGYLWASHDTEVRFVGKVFWMQNPLLNGPGITIEQCNQVNQPEWKPDPYFNLHDTQLDGKIGNPSNTDGDYYFDSSYYSLENFYKHTNSQKDSKTHQDSGVM